MTLRQKIKVAIAGVGNCASSLVQGVQYYRDREGDELEGVMQHSIGGYRCGDIEFVAAFDVDRRKVGHPLEEAIFAKPNCTRIFQSALPVSNVVVQMGPILDGVPDHMKEYPAPPALRCSQPAACRSRNQGGRWAATACAELLLYYMPVGSRGRGSIRPGVPRRGGGAGQLRSGLRRVRSDVGEAISDRKVRSSATTSRPRSARRSPTARSPACSPTAA